MAWRYGNDSLTPYLKNLNKKLVSLLTPLVLYSASYQVV